MPFRPLERCLRCHGIVHTRFIPKYPDAVRGPRAAIGRWERACDQGCTRYDVPDPLTRRNR